MYVRPIHSAAQQKLTQQCKQLCSSMFFFFLCGTYMQWNTTQL